MNLYLDASALVKCFVTESGSADVGAAVDTAELVGTVSVTRVEVESAFAKSVRVGLLTEADARQSRSAFIGVWPDLICIHVSDFVVTGAAELVWLYGLRAYDAVQLATALFWQRSIGEAVVFATYDQKLWQAAQSAGLIPFPAVLSPVQSLNP
jgi:predicted nucleic acid-binding protein